MKTIFAALALTLFAAQANAAAELRDVANCYYSIPVAESSIMAKLQQDTLSNKYLLSVTQATRGSSNTVREVVKQVVAAPAIGGPISFVTKTYLFTTNFTVSPGHRTATLKVNRPNGMTFNMKCHR